MLPRQFCQPSIRGCDERRLVFLCSLPHQPEDDQRRDEATIRPGEEVKGRQDEFEEVGEAKPHPRGRGVDALEHQEKGKGCEKSVMVPDDGRGESHQNEQRRDGVQQAVFFAERLVADGLNHHRE